MESNFLIPLEERGNISQYNQFIGDAYNQAWHDPIPLGFTYLFYRHISNRKWNSQDRYIVVGDRVWIDKATSTKYKSGHASEAIAGVRTDSNPSFQDSSTFGNYGYQCPYTSQRTFISSAEIEVRPMGYSPTALAELAGKLPNPSDQSAMVHSLLMANAAEQEYTKFMQQLLRQHEFDCARALIDGQLEIENRFGGTATVNFGRHSELTRNLSNNTTKWTKDSTNIVRTLTDASRAMYRYGKVRPDWIIMSQDVYEVFRENKHIIERAVDPRRLEGLAGAMPHQPERTPFNRQLFSNDPMIKNYDNGLHWVYAIDLYSSVTLQVYTYDEGYQDAGTGNNPTETTYLPANTALLGSNNARLDRYFAGSKKKIFSTDEQHYLSNVLKLPVNQMGFFTDMWLRYKDRFTANDGTGYDTEDNIGDLQFVKKMLPTYATQSWCKTDHDYGITCHMDAAPLPVVVSPNSYCKLYNII